MRAARGDEIVVPSEHVGQPERHGVILEVRGEDGAPPYVVRWDGADKERLFFPGADTSIEPRSR